MPRSAVGEACVFGENGCTAGAACNPPIEGGLHGTCQCDKIFGLSGPNCDEVTGAGWMLRVGCALSLLFANYVIAVNIGVGSEMRSLGKLKFDDMGRTLGCNFILAVAIASLDLCLIISVRGLRQIQPYVDYIVCPSLPFPWFFTL